MARAKLDDNGQVWFRCPACEHIHALNVNPENGKPCWGFNHNYDLPTFTPSIKVSAGKYANPEWFASLSEEEKEFHEKRSSICHSYVTDGRIKFEGDSTHSMAGQVVDLPEI